MSATPILLALGLAAALPAALFAVLFAGVAIAYVRRAVFAPAAVAAGIGLLVRETWAQLVILAWTAARRGRTLDGAAASGVPVVLVHGLAADGTSMFAYRRAIAATGRPTSSPHLGGMFRPIEKYALRLTRHLEAVLAAHPAGPDGDGGVDVVCHSMGGIVLRACLAMRPDLGERIRHVVTVASPHAGTLSAKHVPFVEARQLVKHSAYIDGLPPLPALVPHAKFTTIASVHDAVVYPHDTCCVAGADHHELSGYGHAELLTHKDVVDLVVASVQ